MWSLIQWNQLLIRDRWEVFYVGGMEYVLIFNQRLGQLELRGARGGVAGWSAESAAEREGQDGV